MIKKKSISILKSFEQFIDNFKEFMTADDINKKVGGESGNNRGEMRKRRLKCL